MASSKSSQQPDVMEFRAHVQYFNALWHFYDTTKHALVLFGYQGFDLEWDFKKMLR